MAYPSNTILERTEPLPDNDPLNVLRVIGSSPVKVASRSEWAGSGGEQLIVAPVEEFGANEVIPEVVLNRDYEVRTYGDEEPATQIHLDPRRERLLQGETPEQAFARAAREGAKEEKPKRGRTAIKSGD